MWRCRRAIALANFIYAHSPHSAARIQLTRIAQSSTMVKQRPDSMSYKMLFKPIPFSAHAKRTIGGSSYIGTQNACNAAFKQTWPEGPLMQ